MAKGSDAPLTSIHVFGDSMSDSGAYAAQSPAGAGKFTTNPDPVWVELIASGLGLPTLTSHADGGSNYAEGGARVATSFTRPGDGLPTQFSRTSVVSQVEGFFAAGGAFNSQSLVIIQGGGNDVFDTLLNGRTYTAADIQSLTTAATALATQVKRVKDSGAGMVVTVSVPQFDVYNALYKQALAATRANVLFFDTYGLVAQIQAEPSRYGLVNTTDPACNVGAIGSYLCTPALYVTPDANKTYLFADAIHFTGAGQQMEADGVLSALRAPGLVGSLSYVAQAAGDAQARVMTEQIDSARDEAPGGWNLFGALSTADVRIDGSPQRDSSASDIATANAGAVYALSQTALVGAALTFSSSDGDFGGDGGGFQARTVGLGVFARGRWANVTGWAEADYGHTAFDDISRRVVIGPAMLSEVGSTDGDRFAVAAGGSAAFTRSGVRITPKVSLRYDHGRIAAYAEQGDDATQMTFGSQKLETLVASAGLRLSPAVERTVRPYVELGYADELLGRDRQIRVVSHGAPVAWTTPIFTADRGYVTYGAGLTARVGDGVDVTIGVQSVGDRGALDTASSFVSFRAVF